MLCTSFSYIMYTLHSMKNHAYIEKTIIIEFLIYDNSYSNSVNIYHTKFSM